MDEEEESWSRWRIASSGFCLRLAVDVQASSPRVIGTIVEDELEWCGSHALLFVALRYSCMRDKVLSKEGAILELENICTMYEKNLNDEQHKSSSLSKKLRQVSLSAEDSIWELQEHNAVLKSRLEEAQNRLIEVESFLTSDRGSVMLQMEEALAECKLRVAELEAAKDDYEVELAGRRRDGSGDKENRSNGAVREGKSSFGLSSFLS